MYLKYDRSLLTYDLKRKSSQMDAVSNRRKEWYVLDSIANVNFRTKHPAELMVLGSVTSDEKKLPNSGENVVADAYYKLKARDQEGSYAWTQYGASSHTTKKRLKFSKNFSDVWTADFWTFSNLDVNSLIYEGSWQDLPSSLPSRTNGLKC